MKFGQIAKQNNLNAQCLINGNPFYIDIPAQLKLNINYNPLLYADSDGLYNYFSYLRKIQTGINSAYLTEIPRKIYALKAIKNNVLSMLKVTEQIYNITETDYTTFKQTLNTFENGLKAVKTEISAVKRLNTIDNEYLPYELQTPPNIEHLMPFLTDLENTIKHLKTENADKLAKRIKTKKGYKFVIFPEHSVYLNRVKQLKDTIKLIETRIKFYYSEVKNNSKFIENLISDYDVLLLKEGKISDNIRRYLKFKFIPKHNTTYSVTILEIENNHSKITKHEHKTENAEWFLKAKNSQINKQIINQFLTEQLPFISDNLAKNKVNEFVLKFHEKLF